MTLTDFITLALLDLGAIQDAQPLPQQMLGNAKLKANNLIDSWFNDGLKIWSVAQAPGSPFTLPGNKGGATPYTIGTGGDINIERPRSIARANNVLSTGGTNIRVPIQVLQDADEWASLPVLSVTSSVITKLWFDRSYSYTAGNAPNLGLGNLYLWPTPASPVPLLELYVEAVLTEFADFTTDYEFPRGFNRMFQTALAVELIPSVQLADQNVIARVIANAADAATKFELNNLPSPTLRVDPIGQGQGGSAGYTNYIPDYT